MSGIPKTPSLGLEHENAYYHALGRLVHAFGMVETSLNFEITALLMRAGSLDEQGNPTQHTHKLFRDAARTVAQGGRYASRRDALKRLLRTLSAPPKIVSELEIHFQQIGTVQSLRDNLVHQPPVYIEGETWRWSNFATANEAVKIKDNFITVAQVMAAGSDLLRSWSAIPQILRSWTKENRESADFEARIQSLREPWQYKP